MSHLVSMFGDCLKDISYLKAVWLLRGLYSGVRSLAGVDHRQSSRGPNDKPGLLNFRKRSWLIHAVGIGCGGFLVWNLTRNCLTAAPLSGSLQSLLTLLASPLSNRSAPEDVLLASELLLLHASRRLYEDLSVSIFSGRQVYNPVSLFLSLSYYALVALTTVADVSVTATPLGWQRLLTFFFTPRHLFGIALYAFGSWLQHKHLYILSRLRRNKSGHVVTSAYKIPKNGWFDLVSNPHYLGEVLVYVAIQFVIGCKSSWSWLTVSVAVSQIARARESHQWYINNVKDYPKDRKMIIPKVL